MQTLSNDWKSLHSVKKDNGRLSNIFPFYKILSNIMIFFMGRTNKVATNTRSERSVECSGLIGRRSILKSITLVGREDTRF